MLASKIRIQSVAIFDPIPLSLGDLLGGRKLCSLRLAILTAFREPVHLEHRCSVRGLDEVFAGFAWFEEVYSRHIEVHGDGVAPADFCVGVDLSD